MLKEVSLTPEGMTNSGVNSKKLVHGKISNQSIVLNKFMTQHFSKGILFKYSRFFIPDDKVSNVDYIRNHLNYDKSAKFLEVMLKRARSTKLQFKKVCCIIIKYLECCNNETNYMEYLKYDFHKLIVVAFILSVPNVHGNEGDKITKRNIIYKSYSRITGLSVQELTNCCSIVRPVLIRRSRKQYDALRPKQENTHSFTRRINNDSGDSASDNDIFENHGFTFDANSMNRDDRNNGFSISRNPWDLFPSASSLSASTSSLYDQTSNQLDDTQGDYHHHFNPPSSVDVQSNIITGSPTLAGSCEPGALGLHDTAGSNGYILPAELEQFNEMGKKLVLECFTVI